MQELLDINPAVKVQESEYIRLLGYPKDYKLKGRSKELANMTSQWYVQNGKPWVYTRPADNLTILENVFKINGIEFHSKYLLNQLKKAKADKVMLVAVSAGPECERQAAKLWKEHKPDEYFFMEMYGSAVVEHLVATTGARFCAWADQEGLAVLPHYSPGYSGWDVKAQNTLLSLIRQSEKFEFPENLSVMETGMLNPKKSMLAIFGITKDISLTQDLEKLIPCENCALPHCKYRRAPYQRPLRPIEDVSRLQPKIQQEVPQRKVILDTDASYSVNTRALEKWSRDLLTLDISDDGRVNARFRYEGSTCSNMGFPLAYDYEVIIDSPQNDYKILELSCAPVPGDTGHTQMCSYTRNPEKLERAIKEEKPLLGQPLNDILNWERASRPSGCYCDRSSRNHKWGLVFEVIHYALVQKMKKQKQLSMISEQ